MVLPTKLHEDYVRNVNTIRIGKTVPANAVNLAYYYNRTSKKTNFIISDSVKNSSKPAQKWLTKRGILLGDMDSLPKSLYYNASDYSGQLKRKFIEWSFNKTEEKEIKESTITLNKVEGNLETNIVDGIYSGTQYLMEAEINTTETQNISRSILVYKQCNEEQVILSDSNMYTFPDNISYNKNGFRGVLYKNGEMQVETMFASDMEPDSNNNLKPVTSVKYKLTQRYSAVLSMESKKLISLPLKYNVTAHYKGVLTHSTNEYSAIALYSGNISEDKETHANEIRLKAPEETEVLENWYPIIQFGEKSITYRGFYDAIGNFIDLDLNPNMYHSYTDNSSASYTRKPVYTLINKEIYFFQKKDNSFYHKIGISTADETDDITIGSISFRQTSYFRSTVLMDSRTKGGGLICEIDEALRKKLEPEADYYWDIGYYDGRPYMENAVIIIRLDRRLLKEFGGSFTTDEVEAVVHKWIAFGVSPIIEYVKTYSKEELPQSSLKVDFSYENKLDFVPYAFSALVKE
ncbi:hypothetical protein [Clostridium felsineum]|uniref:Uncharacterized protein n=1 Tax=Clostridium felsineum TaxID=36839 RepID=A0A1S8L1U2_9CLOT|nr:hypothetical protein [Clostridium felsineum]URZ09228.1 hypothetical protein CLROS_046440 [Clostridium felsineum]URZ13914.1 hypothetical protein CROST_046920 [Clostridium felsineum]